jgi:hypothetical protein
MRYSFNNESTLILLFISSRLLLDA